MRVTEHRLMQQAADAVERARERASKAAGELQSGQRVRAPSDDPTAWAEGVRAETRHAMSEARSSGALGTGERMVATDDALGRVGDALSQLQELAVELGNGTISASERQAAVASVNAIRAEMLAAANARGADGEYLLAGDQGQAAPFTTAGVYVGDRGQRSIETSETGSLVVNTSGDVLTASSGVDVFAVVDGLATALAANNQTGVQSAVGTLRSAIDQVASARADLGGRLALLEASADQRAQLESRLSEVYTRAIAADPVRAASEFSEAQGTFAAAQRVAQQIVNLLAVR